MLCCEVAPGVSGRADMLELRFELMSSFSNSKSGFTQTDRDDDRTMSEFFSFLDRDGNDKLYRSCHESSAGPYL